MIETKYLVALILGILIGFLFLTRKHIKKIHSNNEIFPNMKESDIEKKEIDQYHLDKKLAYAFEHHKEGLKKNRSRKISQLFAKKHKQEIEAEKEHDKKISKIAKNAAFIEETDLLKKL